AFLILYFSDVTAANRVILTGGVFSWKHTCCVGKKHLKEVLWCYRCQRFGHIGSECKISKKFCGQCAGKHDILECDSSTTKCVNCNSTDHSSRDWNCPEFIC
ncbi:hypothetical protein L218DRAFT_878489, partial [Marasmius fiardii PR-910]